MPETEDNKIKSEVLKKITEESSTGNTCTAKTFSNMKENQLTENSNQIFILH